MKEFAIALYIAFILTAMANLVESIKEKNSEGKWKSIMMIGIFTAFAVMQSMSKVQ
jgi:hypothetical protein